MAASRREWVITGTVALGMHLAVLIGLTEVDPRAIGDTQTGQAGLQRVSLLPPERAPGPEAPAPSREPSVQRPVEPSPPAAVAPAPQLKPPEPPQAKQADTKTSAQPPQAPTVARPPPLPAKASASPRSDAVASVPAVSSQPVPDATEIASRAAGSRAAEAEAAEAERNGVTQVAATERYLAELAAWLERHKQYPKRAQRRRQQGTVELSFVVDRRGRVLRYDIVRSSGYPLLDDAVRRLVERAQPLPGVPPDLGRGHLALRLPVGFYLR